MWFMRASQWIGRDQRCELRIHAGGVSACHATLTWADPEWILRDLNSTNGTFVNGVRLGQEKCAVVDGDELQFGKTEQWEVEDAGPPGLLLIAADSSEELHVSTRTGIAVLPSAAAASLTVMRTISGAWHAETADDTWALAHGDELRFGDRVFRALIPTLDLRTTDVDLDHDENSLANAWIEIAVSDREEEADMTLRVGGRSHRIVDRVPLYLLVLLARARKGPPHTIGHDTGSAKPLEGEASTDADGWLTVGEACRQLAASPELLNLHVFRVRECLRDLGITNANQIIERRKGRLRIGIDPARLRIVRAR